MPVHRYLTERGAGVAPPASRYIHHWRTAGAGEERFTTPSGSVCVFTTGQGRFTVDPDEAVRCHEADRAAWRATGSPRPRPPEVVPQVGPPAVVLAEADRPAWSAHVRRHLDRVAAHRSRMAAMPVLAGR